MSQRAVVVVDIQNEYFPQGNFPLVGIEAAAANAAKVITAARSNGDLVIHVRHEMPGPDAPIFVPGSDGVRINERVAPQDGETVIVKNFANSFRETALKQLLDDAGVTEVVVVGAMSHMCIDATVRAAVDFGYTTTTLHDACATRDLEFGGHTVPAAQVHTAQMAALAFMYGEVTDTASFLAR